MIMDLITKMCYPICLKYWEDLMYFYQNILWSVTPGKLKTRLHHNKYWRTELKFSR